MFRGKYNVGDKVFVKIGERPLVPFTIVERVNRKGPHYKFDWAEHGFNAILNTVAVPECSILHKVE